MPLDRRTLVLAGALLLAPAFVHAQCPDGTPPPCAGARPLARVTVPSATDRARRFLLLPFRNVTRQPEQDWLVEGSTTMLAEALGRWQGITVVSDERLYPALRRAGLTPGSVLELPKVRRVAEETGGWTAVTGDVINTGGRVRISARAWDVPSNRELVRASGEVAAGGDVRAVYDSVSLRLLRSVGLDSAGPDLAGATTSDLDAYRAYLRGLAHLRSGEVRAATAEFEDAVRRDSSFALAWARLAETAQAGDPATIFNPASKPARYVARAAALANRLPPRQRQLVLAMEASFHAQFGVCRRILSELLAADSNDVDALEQMVALEMFDPILIGSRPRGSPNRAARLAKRVVELDPSRHTMYSMLASIYAGAGIPSSQPTLGVDREPVSVADLIQILQAREHMRIFGTVLRDSIVVVPVESLATIPKDSVKASRRVARGYARSWAERWVAVAPGETAAHQLTAELLSYDGEYAGALRSLAVAESLGIQTPAYVPQARRLLFTAKSGDVGAAARMADSLTAAGFFANPSNVMTNSDAGQWAFMIHLLQDKPELAAALMTNTTTLIRIVNASAPAPKYQALRTLMGSGDPEEEPRIPRALRAQVLDSALRHVNDLAANPDLAPWLPVLLPVLAEFAGQEKTRAGSILEAGDSLAAHGRQGLAFQMMVNMIEDYDSTAEAMAAQRPWYRTGAEAYNRFRARTAGRMHTGSASVAADRATFEWRVDDAAPFVRNSAESPPNQREYGWGVFVPARSRYYRFFTGSLIKSADAAPDSGSLADLLPQQAPRIVVTGLLGPNEAQLDTTLLQSVALRAETAPGVLRFVVTDPEVVGFLRRERPATATFRFRPCVRALGGNRECHDEQVAITYP